jgi:hypothetical protein
MRAVIITIKSISLMALLTVAFAAHAQSPKPDVADVLKAISEQLKPLSVSEHNLAEMRDVFFGRKDISDEESAHVNDVLATTKAFRKALDPAFFVGRLVAEMRLPADADTVRRTFYVTANNMVTSADFDVIDVNKYMTVMRNTAAKAQAARVRDAMIAIRDILQSVPKND